MDGFGNSLRGGPDGNKRAVVYYYDPEIGTYCYGPGHHMKPQRVKMAHDLLVSYGVHQKMEVLKPLRAEYQDFCRFHKSDYVTFLQAVTPETQNQHHKSVVKKYMGDLEECPIFDGLYSFCQTSAGGSISGAMKLNDGHTDIAINWAGGLHHAKKCQASGFCYINDIVLAILELLKHHGRVLYIDIDVHHGDGVEEAFNDTDRVMTVSFHRFGNGYFPETGDIGDVGVRKGKYYSLNVPLYAGIDDESYQSLFKPIMSKAMEVFQPGAVVLQCGADSLSGDCLGDFNLSVKGHAECVNFMRSFNVPLLLLGGGGYTIKNVAKCWCYETGVAVGVELEDKGLDETLQVEPSIMENKNPRTYLESIKARLLDNLSKLDHVPSVQFSERPPDTDLGEEQEQDVDSRSKSRVRYGEIYDSDSEEDYLRECERPSRVISEPAFLRKPEIVNAEHTKEAMPTLEEEHAKTSSSTPSTGEENDCEYEMQRPQKETEKTSSQKDENDGEDHMAEPMKALSKQNKCEDGVCTKLHICRSKASGI